MSCSLKMNGGRRRLTRHRGAGIGEWFDNLPFFKKTPDEEKETTETLQFDGEQVKVTAKNKVMPRVRTLLTGQSTPEPEVQDEVLEQSSVAQDQEPIDNLAQPQVQEGVTDEPSSDYQENQDTGLPETSNLYDRQDTTQENEYEDSSDSTYDDYNRQMGGRKKKHSHRNKRRRSYKNKRSHKKSRKYGGRRR